MSLLLREGPARVPVFVLLLMAFAVGLALAYVIDYLVGAPIATLAKLIDLDGERNLPTWYSSVLWFSAALASFGVAERRVRSADPRSWSLWLLPLLFLAFSVDEVVQVHEAIGVQSDVVLPDATRVGTAFPETGLFFLVLGLPTVIGVTAILIAMRPSLTEPDGGFMRVAVGFALMLTGAVLFDFLANFVAEHSLAAITLITIEESLEMAGAITILWGLTLLLWPPDRREGVQSWHSQATAISNHQKRKLHRSGGV